MNNESRPLAIGLLTAALVLGEGANAQDARFVEETATTSTEGHLILQWQSDATAAFYQIEHDLSRTFDSPTLWYQGRATQTFISGLEEREHFYRVRAREGETGPWGRWSEPLVFTVEHQSMNLAWALFGMGAVLFLSIVGFVVWASVGRRLSEGIASE